MDINEISTVYEVMKNISKRIKSKGCKEGNGNEETCKYIFSDFDDWCNICVLETALYFLAQSIKINEQVVINEEKTNASRQANQGTPKIPNGNGSGSSKS